jgi:ribosomal protein S18 acetylase RimI-like enzyme
MITLELITAQNAMAFREVRLRALHDAPTAFSSTYADESRLTDTDWVQRAEQWTGERSVGYLAMDAGSACGIAAGVLDQANPTRASLMSMWIAPTHRRRGIGGRLVDAVITWARARQARTIGLIVTSNNIVAIRFYESLGFMLTRTVKPYKNDPALNDLEMVRLLS